MTKKEVLETQSELIQFKTTPTIKSKLQALAEKDNRKLADFIRVYLTKLIK